MSHKCPVSSILENMLNLSARKAKSLNDIFEVFKKGDYAESRVSFNEEIIKEHFKKLNQAKKDIFLSLGNDLQSKDEESDSNISDMDERNEEKELKKLKESKDSLNEDDRVKRDSRVILFFTYLNIRDECFILFLD